MESGYKILWTDHALKELANTYEYLEANFTTHELKKLSIEIDNTLKLISKTLIYFQYQNQKELEELLSKNSIQCITGKRKMLLKFFRFSLTDKIQLQRKYNNWSINPSKQPIHIPYNSRQ